MASTAARLDAAQVEDKRNLRKVVAASFIGTTIEWYDFFLYGTAAALVFGELFFPGSSPLIGTLSAFGTFAVGFAARPLGGIVFGHFGDRIGRKAMLVTVAADHGRRDVPDRLPADARVDRHRRSDPARPAALRAGHRRRRRVGRRGPDGRRAAPRRASAGSYGAFPQMGVPAGLLLSTVVFTVVQNMTTEDQFMAWGWRIPFLVSIVLVAVGLFVRLALAGVAGVQGGQGVQDRGRRAARRARQDHKRDVLTAMGMRIAENGCFYIFTVFVLHYGEETLGLEKNTMLTGVIIAAAIGLLTVPFYGWLSDRFGRRKLYMAGAVFTLAFAFPFFALLDTKEPVLIWLAIVLAVNVGHDLMYGPQAAYFSELFATRMRYTGASVGYQLASVFGGGFAPLIAVALLAAGGDEPYLVALYMMGMGLITVVATYFARETFKSDISDSDAHRAGADRALRAQAETADRETTGVA